MEVVKCYMLALVHSDNLFIFSRLGLYLSSVVLKSHTSCIYPLRGTISKLSHVITIQAFTPGWWGGIKRVWEPISHKLFVSVSCYVTNTDTFLFSGMVINSFSLELFYLISCQFIIAKRIWLSTCLVADLYGQKCVSSSPLWCIINEWYYITNWSWRIPWPSLNFSGRPLMDTLT